MQKCSKCGNEIEDGDLFCIKCGNKIENVCKKCGKPYPAGARFCETCGNNLSENNCIAPSVIIREADVPKTQRGYGMIIISIIAIVVFAGLGSYYFYQHNPPNKINYEQTTKPNIIKPPEQNKNTNNVIPEIKKIVSATGIIKGNDVIVRTDPSVTTTAIDYVDDGLSVTVLSKQKCEDQNAAIINVPSITVTVDGKNILLKKGQALKIISLDGNVYKCEAEINKRMTYIYINQPDIRKIYGDVWYKVQLENNKIGWIYGDYIQTNM